MVAEKRAAEHISPEELEEYFDGGLTEAREGEVEEHLADCEQCTRLARKVQNFSMLLEGWTARAHGEAYLRAQVVQGLELAGQHATNPQWQMRLRQWAGRWGGRAEAAARVILEAPGRAGRIAAEGLEALARPGATWQLASARTPVRTRGVVARGKPPAAAPGKLHARITATEAGEVVVHFNEWTPGEPLPLVLLSPTKMAGEPRVQEPKMEPGIAYLVARFEGVEPGEYIVALEPKD